jgi:hypothetical protein
LVRVRALAAGAKASSQSISLAFSELTGDAACTQAVEELTTVKVDAFPDRLSTPVFDNLNLNRGLVYEVTTRALKRWLLTPRELPSVLSNALKGSALNKKPLARQSASKTDAPILSVASSPLFKLLSLPHCCSSAPQRVARVSTHADARPHLRRSICL